MRYTIKGVELTNVIANNITISGVNVYGAPAEDIAAIVAEHAGISLSGSSKVINEYRKIYLEATGLIEALRSVTVNIFELRNADYLLDFLNEYIRVLKRLDDFPPGELVDCLTTLGILHRLIGQQLQLQHARNDHLVNPVTVSHHRERLSAVSADQQNFTKADAILKEALAICESKFGSHSFKSINIRNELGLLNRDRGQYKQAVKDFLENMRILRIYYPSAKESASEAYFNAGLTNRDRHFHLLALWNYKSSKIFAEWKRPIIGEYTEDAEDKIISRAISSQIPYSLFYCILNILLFLTVYFIFWVAIGNFGSFPLIIVSAFIYYVIQWFYFMSFDKIISTLFTAAFIGVEYVRWPKQSEDITMQLNDELRRLHEKWKNSDVIFAFRG